jgi:UDP-3-O-[3-hydroxymyristoyl] glucosamine N-acyltransferase
MVRQSVFTIDELAQATNSKLVGNPNHKIKGVADLESATPDDASFLANARYEQAMRRSKAGVILVDAMTLLTEGGNYLINENPSRAFQQLIELFFQPVKNYLGNEGIHPTAVIHPTARIASNVTLGPFVVIGQEVVIGNGSFVHAHVCIGDHSLVGESCIIHPHVVIREGCRIGNRVILQPGAVIGSCGFGYITDKSGSHTKLEQLGGVVIEDDVEIGANTTIDRGRFKNTLIGSGTKIDNLVQIGHGVQIGERNIIVSQTGIAGSTTTGKNVVIGGQAGITGHLKICGAVMIAARAGIDKSITKPGKYGGAPALPMDENNRNTVLVRNIQKYVGQIKELQKRIELLEAKNNVSF